MLYSSTIGAIAELHDSTLNTVHSDSLNSHPSDERPSQSITSTQAAYIDFRQADNGVLIHENCFAPERWSFNVQKAVSSSYAKGAHCLAGTGTEHQAISGFNETNHQVLELLSKLIDPSNWQAGALPYAFSADGEEIVFSDCSLLRKSGFFAREIPADCSVDTLLGTRPKIFCNRDLSDKYRELVEHMRNSVNTAPDNPVYSTYGNQGPIIMVHEEHTTIYSGPAVIFIAEHTTDWDRATFESFLFHETIHNLGFAHPADGRSKTRNYNDYSVFCQAACFSQAHPQLSASDIQRSREYCFNPNYIPLSDSESLHLRNKLLPPASEKLRPP